MAAAAEAMAEGRRLQGRRLQASSVGGVGGVGGMGGITMPAPSDLLHAWDEQAAAIPTMTYYLPSY